MRITKIQEKERNELVILSFSFKANSEWMFFVSLDHRKQTIPGIQKLVSNNKTKMLRGNVDVAYCIGNTI